VILILVSAALVFLTIVVPLRSTVDAAGPALAVAGTAYFSLIGIGFMMAEIALLQRMSVFLGHPVYALSVVLFSLILSTGLGSFASERFPLNRTEQARFLGEVYRSSFHVLAADKSQSKRGAAHGEMMLGDVHPIPLNANRWPEHSLDLAPRRSRR
jgi:hypothetical protein